MEEMTDTGKGVADWSAAVNSYIEHLKYREKKYRRDAEDAQIKADTVQKERMELENQLYKAGLRN